MDASTLPTTGAILEPSTAPAQADATRTRPEWSLVKRVAFRFLTAYAVLYLFPFPLNQIPLVQQLFGFWFQLNDKIVLWTGKQFFGLDITIRPAGSGDTTWNYVQLLVFFTLALIITLVWSLLDRKRTSYNRLHQWLRVYARFWTGSILISYGAFKIIKSQFPAAPLDKLILPFGDSSPMGLLWSFMGYSYPYNVFTGAGEMIGGILLFFPSLVTLGALVSIGVMSHVVMLNYAYDVPVKLYSSHLLAASVFLLAPEIRRLTNFFVLHRPVGHGPALRLFQRPNLHYAAVVLRVVALAWFIWQPMKLSWNARHAPYGDLGTKPPLWGIYDVAEFQRNGEPVTPLLTDSTYWRRVIIPRPNQMVIKAANEQTTYFQNTTDTVAHSITVRSFADTTRKATLAYAQPEPDLLELRGPGFNGDTLFVRLRRFDEKRFLLLSRGYNWINERPFNR